MKKTNVIVIIIFGLLIAWLTDSWKPLLLFFGVIVLGYLYALQYRHLWKDVPDLFKGLKKTKKD